MTNDLKEILVGCIPNSFDFQHPADRRRYIPFFRDNEIKYEIADFEKNYDILIVSINSDLEKWSSYNDKRLDRTKSTRIIFDLSDLYQKGQKLSWCF